MDSGELKIELYPDEKPRGNLEKQSLKEIYITKGTLGYSFNENQNLAFANTNVPLLNGFYTAHINHYPIRIKPDDIWLLIVQAFSHHVNFNSEKLRKYFVNFDGKKELIVEYILKDLSDFDVKYLKDFCIQINKQMEEYLGKEILENLTSNFSTTDENSIIISKISIMGAFKKYFEYISRRKGCGIPYLILEGTAEDYKKIKSKAENLKKYEFEWYIDRIMPYLEKMIEAKEGKIDVDFFKNIVQKNEITTTEMHGSRMKTVKVDSISGWILKFFSHISYKNRYYEKNSEFMEDEIQIKDFPKLANQMLIVPFKIVDEEDNNKEYLMKYQVGFIGCEQNDKNEIYPVQGWIVTPSTKEERESLL